MSFYKFKTREERLINKLNNSFLNKKLTKDEINEIVEIFNQYEKVNIDTINKLKKDKQIETKRISGAIKSFLNAHPVLTKELIGSLTKRIYGSLLNDNTIRKKNYITIHKSSLFLGLTIVFVFFIFIFLTHNF